MSKFIPDPQIQSLRAMRAGDIAMPSTPTMSVGVLAFAIGFKKVAQSVALVAVDSEIALSGTPSESPVVGESFLTAVTKNANQSITLLTTNALETLAGTPSESPTVGVATATSVI